jgi:carboxymethylenebutenolidase
MSEEDAMQTRDVELGYLALSEGGASPGVVMVHDVWGLGDHARDMARRLAGEGFAVLAVDLYRRDRPEKISDPGAFMRAMSDAQVLGDVAAAGRFLAGLPDTTGKIGVTGFCMGGMYALMAACGEGGGDFDASVPFYGLLSHRHGILHGESGPDAKLKPREPLAVARGLRCPLLTFYGDRDEFVPMDDVRALERALVEADAPAELIVVPGAGHAFMNDTREAAYRPDAAEQAWRRTVEFLKRELR